MIRCLLLWWTAAAYAQSVQGVVVNKLNQKPVAGAMVQLAGIAEDADPDIYRGTSDAAGKFRFDGVAPGSYRALAQAPGYTRMQADDKAARIAVERGSAAPPLTLSLTPSSVISGRVADQDGDPVAYASVEALQYGYQDGKKTLQRIGNVRTDDRGEYRIFGIAPGHYYVRATLRGGPVTYSPTYFSGAREASRAPLVEAPPAGEAHSIDITLNADPPHSISGRVVDGETGQAAAGVYVTVRTADGFAGGGPQVTDSFTVRDLPAGKYVLYAQQFSSGSSKTARVQVDLGNADLNGLQLSLTPGVNLPGSVRVGDAAPGAGIKLHFSLEGEDYNVEADVNPQGNFTFARVLAGSYRLAWTLPKGFYVQSIRQGDRVLPDDRIEVAGTSGPIAIRLAADGGRITGVVRNGAGEAVAGASVALVASPSYDFWSATSDEKGQFEIPDIAPGEYRLTAFQDAPAGAAQDPDFRKPYEKSAVAVQVLPSTQQKIDVTAVAVR